LPPDRPELGYRSTGDGHSQYFAGLDSPQHGADVVA
jgi:hypothetical protein